MVNQHGQQDKAIMKDVSSREPFADGAIEVSKWLINQSNGLYNMDDFCRE